MKPQQEQNELWFTFQENILEHAPLSKQEIYTQRFHGRLGHRRVYIMFVHVYALFIHVLTILRSNNEGHDYCILSDVAAT